ncbi:MAG: 2-dehydro-3-deoxygluconokinase [Betaproteobacteria bacterium]|nr:2-dehydro-3-deoxygluconokinase [Betaproteobacteria bacterium]
MIEFNQTRPGEPNYLQGYGGDTSNAIIACARQGAPCGYITRIGDDEFGRMLEALWRAEGVDTRGVGIAATAHTAVYFVTHDARGHVFSYLRQGSAASRMVPGDLPVQLIEGARYLHVSGISQAISESAADTAFQAMQIARAAGVKVAYDTNLRLKLWPLERAREVMLRAIALADYLLPSLEDMQALSGLNEPDAIIDWCLAQGTRNVVLKLGHYGCIAATREERTRIAGHTVDAVDATGAGDCFDGAFLARLHFGDDLLAAARYANAAAALTTTGFGAVAPLPRREAVQAFLEQA